jgi:hypothetical protein
MTSASSDVCLDTDGHIAVITLERTAKLNAMTPEMTEADLGGTELRLADTVVNAGFDRTPHMFFHHVNVGWPLPDEGTRYDTRFRFSRRPGGPGHPAAGTHHEAG